MAYTIYNNDGTVLSTIAVGEVDTYSTSLDLIGKNVNNYGEYYNNNLVKLLTNSASVSSQEPRSPQTGQLWYNKSEKQLQVYDSTIGTFKNVGGAILDGTPPTSYSTGSRGTFWFDEPNGQLNVWNGTRFILIGPDVSRALGTFGILPSTFPIREYTSALAQKTSVINSYGTYVGLVTTSSFTMEASSSTVFFGTSTTTSIVKGLTIFGDIKSSGGIISGRTPPPHNSSTGTQGEIAIDSSYLYICTNTNAWARIALTSTTW